MTVTAYNVTRLGNLSVVEVTSDLAGSIWFFWYLDGCYVARTTAPTYTFEIPTGDQARVECLDSNDAEFDPVANAPDAYPPRRSLWWVRSVEAVDHYRLEQNADGAGWSIMARVWPRPGQWDFSYLTGRLTDLASYQWRVVPVDAAGNDGTPLELDAHTVVRTPDAPAFAIAFDEDTTEVTISAA